MERTSLRAIWPILLVMVGVCLLFTGGCEEAGPRPVIVGAKPFAEQRILSEILIRVLQDAGVDALKGPESLNQIRDLQKEGQIDVYWEYTGTALKQHFNWESSKVPRVREDAMKVLNDLDTSNGLKWLLPAKLDNSFAIVLGKSLAVNDPAMETISQLIDYARAEEAPFLCAEPEWFRLGGHGLLALQKKYDYEWPEDRWVDAPGETRYEALKEGKCEALVGYATDSLIDTTTMKVLRDDRTFFPPYQPAPVFRQIVLERLRQQNDGIVKRLKCISNVLDTETMRALNFKVEIGESEPGAVARGFLESSDCAVQP